MNLTVLSRKAFSETNGDHGQTLELSDGCRTNVWDRKTFVKNDGSTVIIEKGQQVRIKDLDDGEIRFATVMAIRKNSVDIALSEDQWEMRFPSGQFIDPV